MDSNLNGKIDQFVRFYAGLFRGRYQFDKADGSQVSSPRKLFGPTLNKAIANPKTRILFVFNGQDLLQVQTAMRNCINSYLHNTDMLIYDHQVICVWCDSIDLISWKQTMELAEKERQLAEKDREIAEKDRKIQELRLAVQRLSGTKRNSLSDILFRL